MKNKQNIAAGMILSAGCMWGSMGLWVRRFSSAGLAAFEILSIRIITTVILLGMYLFLTQKELLKIRLRDSWCFVGTGIMSIVFFGYCYNRTILLTSLSVAAILLYTAPIFVVVLSYFCFREAFTRRKCSALLLAFLGCIFVTGFGGGDQISTMGLLTGLGSGFGYALYSIFSRYALEKGYHPFTVTFYTFVFALPMVAVLGNYSSVAGFLGGRTGNVLYSILYALITTVLPYVLYTGGLAHVENGKASIMATIEPVVATFFGIVIYHETMSVQNVIGVLLVLTAIFMLNLREGNAL